MIKEGDSYLANAQYNSLKKDGDNLMMILKIVILFNILVFLIMGYVDGGIDGVLYMITLMFFTANFMLIGYTFFEIFKTI